MPTKSENLVYGLNDRPPFPTMLLLTLQHLFVVSSTLALPVILVQSIAGSFSQIQSLVSYTMVAAGIGSFVQALKRGPLGSGYLLPNLCGPTFLPVSLQAAWLGGLPLMHGMIILAGVFEAIFSQCAHFLRKLFPYEVTGLVVLMVGISLIPIGASKFLGVEYAGEPIHVRYLLVSILTLFTMAGINSVLKGSLKSYCVLIGMVLGYILSASLGYLTLRDISSLLHEPWFSFPGGHLPTFNFSFNKSLIMPFIIVSLVGALKTFGNISMAQKINNSDWKEADTKNIGKGLLADSVSVIISGVLGGMATDSSSSNVGLSLATGITSRIIGFLVGICYVFLGFSPKVAAIFSIMPAPVIGAILIFVTSFMIISGFQIILQFKPTVKTTFIVGLPFCIGLSVDIMPALYSTLPHWVQPFFNSGLTLSTVSAIVLNFLFNIDTFIVKKT